MGGVGHPWLTPLRDPGHWPGLCPRVPGPTAVLDHGSKWRSLPTCVFAGGSQSVLDAKVLSHVHLFFFP